MDWDGYEGRLSICHCNMDVGDSSAFIFKLSLCMFINEKHLLAKFRKFGLNSYSFICSNITN
jgi:hypothetical protein